MSGRAAGDGPGFWVALDAMGVLYRQRGIAAVLVGLARGRGVMVTESAARDAYRRASRGLLDAPGLWQSLGVAAGEVEALDAQLVAGRSLTPGARGFLAGMRAEGVGVGCITNDLASWSADARRVHRLEGDVDPWVVSAEIGVRKPGREIYQAFVDASGCQPARCLFVDDTIENLEAARRLGFQTVWFGADPPGARRDGTAGHRRVDGFEELATCVTSYIDRSETIEQEG
ncbi:MAG TPA: HAD-IA family hydrolase [Actinomycetota bacterium]|nr:HAD-IA family hydrolase [Actinomycetota bacterium]